MGRPGRGRAPPRCRRGRSAASRWATPRRPRHIQYDILILHHNRLQYTMIDYNATNHIHPLRLYIQAVRILNGEMINKVALPSSPAPPAGLRSRTVRRVLPPGDGRRICPREIHSYDSPSKRSGPLMAGSTLQAMRRSAACSIFAGVADLRRSCLDLSRGHRLRAKLARPVVSYGLSGKWSPVSTHAHSGNQHAAMVVFPPSWNLGVHRSCSCSGWHRWGEPITPRLRELGTDDDLAKVG